MEIDLKINEKFGILPDESVLERTEESLVKNGITVYVAETGQEAGEKALEIIPVHSEVMNMSSVTVNKTGLEKEINESGKYNPTRKKLMAMDQDKQGLEMKKLGAAPEWCVGSVHAVTEDGHLFIASQSGSQMPAYSYSASKVILLVGIQKIVKDFDQAIKRIYEYALPLEDDRAQKVYKRHSSVNKILIINKEILKGRMTVIFIKEKIGF